MLQQTINNQYLILQKLGGGGFGDTYLTQDTHKPSRPYVVVKQLKPITNNPQMYQLVQDLFQREAVILEELGNSNNRIPKLYAYFSEQGLFYLVQEYIQGQTLTQMVDSGGAVNETVVREILKNLLYVLNFVHSRGIIHRDIKPDNIIVRSSDNIPVLIDFGAVRESVGTEFNSKGHPVTSKVIGTPGFMPAEQAAGRPVFSSDIYSLGVTMIYLLTAKTPLELQTDARTGDIIWHQYAMHVSPNLRMILDKAIAYHLNERYVSVKEMIDALENNSVPPIPNRNTAPQPQLQQLVGGGGTFNTYIPVPPEIQGWNWGAFLMAGIWPFSNKVWIGLLSWIPIVGFVMPFILGAKGNVWAWRSRQWKSLEDFKAHQRAWTIAGSTMTGIYALIFIFALSIPSSPETETTSPNTAIRPEVPITPTPSTTPTTEALKIQEVVIDNLKNYTYKNNLFSINAPQGWTLKDTSEPGEAIVTWLDKTENGAFQVNVFEVNDKRTQQQLSDMLQKVVKKRLENKTAPQIFKPVFFDGGYVRIVWTYNYVLEGKTAEFTGNSFIVQRGKKISIYQYIIPSQQFDSLSPTIKEILDSYKVDSQAPLP